MQGKARDSPVTRSDYTARRVRLPIAIAALCCAAGSGCAELRTYFADRGRDFGEIFRVQAGIGVGLGASVHAGPVAHVGLGGGVMPYKYGVGWSYGRGYVFGLGGADLFDWEVYWPATWIGDGTGRTLGEAWHSAADRDGRRDVDARSHVCWGFVPGIVTRFPSPEGRLLWTPRGAETNLWGHVHSWDIEAAAYAGLFAVRVGVSPGELVDFVLGWFGVDIARDDRRHRERVADPDA